MPRITKKDNALVKRAEEQASSEKLDRENKLAKSEIVSDAESESSSSSSDEDSDDDFELEMKGAVASRKKKVQVVSDSSEEDEGKAVLAAIERKLDNEDKKLRLLAKSNRQMRVSDDEDVRCDYESTVVQRNRKRRLYRRKMLRGTVKRRRIKRAQEDVTEDFTCGTFLEFGSTVTRLTTKIALSDEEIDQKALKKVFDQYGLNEPKKQSSSGYVCSSDENNDDDDEEDEADIIANKLRFFQSRNMRERIDQLNNLPINPFSEKLMSSNSQKALTGSRHVATRNYHPDIFIKKGIHKLPAALVWKRPFSHLIYQKSIFDPHKEINDFLNRKKVEKDEEMQKLLLEGVLSRVEQRKLAKFQIVAKKEEEDYEKLYLGCESFDDNDQLYEIDEDAPEFDDLVIN